MFQSGDGAKEFFLDYHGQSGGHPLNVNFVGMESLWLQKELVGVAVGKSHHFIFNGGTITGADPFDNAAVHGGKVKILSNDVVGRGIGVGQMTGHHGTLEGRSHIGKG